MLHISKLFYLAVCVIVVISSFACAPGQNINGVGDSITGDKNLVSWDNNGYKQAVSKYNDDLNDWEGDYKGLVSSNGDSYGYDISIYSEDGEFFAIININSWMTGLRAKAKVQEAGDKIEIVFLKDLTPFYQGYKEGEVLLRFSQEDQSICTEWMGLEPPSFLIENMGINKEDVTFKKLPPLPDWIDKAEKELVLKSPSPDNKYIAYVFVSHRSDFDEKLYMLGILPSNQEFHFQSNVYVASKEFEIEWVSTDEKRWEDDEIIVNNKEISDEDVKKKREIIDNVFINYIS